MLGRDSLRVVSVVSSIVLVAVLIGCGGAGGSGGGGLTGGSNGGSSAGQTSAGGTSAGGTSAGGTSAGGTSAGGTSSGGTTSGGTTSGGTTSGGTTSGGVAYEMAYDLNDGSTSALFKSLSDGSSHAQITMSASDIESPKINSVGNKVVFFQALSTVDIYTATITGGSLSNLTSTSGATNIDPCFSPDGSKILFSSDRGGNFQIYSMNVNGTNPVALTNLDDGAFQPCFSPDGQHIAFVSGATNDDIFVMNADGTNVVQLTSDDAYQDEPSWSPDSSTIYFVQDFGTSDVNEQIMSIPLTGGSATRLTTSMLDDRSPVVTADGVTLLFTRNTSGGREVFSMPVAGGTATAISSDGGFAQHVSLSTTAINTAVSKAQVIHRLPIRRHAH